MWGVGFYVTIRGRRFFAFYLISFVCLTLADTNTLTVTVNTYEVKDLMNFIQNRKSHLKMKTGPQIV